MTTLDLDLASPPDLAGPPDLAAVRRAAAEAAAPGPLDVLLQLGPHPLGHLAVTGLLLPNLLASGTGRVVTVSSPAARLARSSRWPSYAGSMLANLVLTVELDRRARAAGAPLTAVAAHPGWVTADGQVGGAIGVAAARLVGQSAAAGAQALVRAATDPGLEGGEYVGPGGPFGLHGPPRVVPMPRSARDPASAARLWEDAERVTGVVPRF
ncbi:hypothetical protein [Nocardioides marmoribigeumensis]|uniref:NAD(P)-dependent dehydrogenase (Short-subunit alcohol dehydrogenase family) n=1 Tax=Nocardioides marmoribigeumensis TaxID=433649 RepID=A0ABU2BVC2_9ACTN|nr:hypothetical protein [Nocardioides marmoribigeumensis]MDR7362592.1 NAD(P)-dependent dehydrogenase (short-subunit alcohol dehydrogenase family) [Nocardioides marmoribigeumensis]